MSRRINIFGSVVNNPLFDPLVYFNSDLGFYLNAVDTDTISKDGSNLVDGWTCQKTGYVFGTDLASEKPTYNATGLNGKPTIEFSIGNLLFYDHDAGLYDDLRNVEGSLGEIWFVNSVDNITVTSYEFAVGRWNHNTGRYSNFRTVNLGSKKFTSVGADTQTATTDLNSIDTNPHLVMYTQSGYGMEIYIDGVLQSLITVTPWWWNWQLYAGCYAVGGLVRPINSTTNLKTYSAANQKISFVMYLRRQTTEEERGYILSWLNSNYGV